MLKSMWASSSVGSRFLLDGVLPRCLDAVETARVAEARSGRDRIVLQFGCVGLVRGDKTIRGFESSR